MTETKLPGMVINRIDKKSTYDSLVEKGEIGENDLCLVEDEDNISPGSGTDISLGVTGASVGDIIKVKQVDASGKPTAWEAVGSTTPYSIISQGDITEDISILEFTGIEGYNDFLFIGNMAAGNASGVRLQFNGKLASVKFGSYFVHNHQKLTVAHLQIDRERKIYLFQATAQQYNKQYNQDSCGDAYGQTLNGDTEITSFSFLMDDTKYIKAGSSYVLYGR